MKNYGLNSNQLRIDESALSFFYMVLCVCRTISVTTQWQGGDVNLYENLRCHGVPLVTVSRGRVVYENGIFTCAEGSGKFYPLRTFPDYLYKKMVQREKVLSPLYIVFLCFYNSVSQCLD